MKLYKNVDICDLESICKNGILSIDDCGNDNWEHGKRANNATDVVYLFSPKGNKNSFPKYGAALIEVEIDNAIQTQISDNDFHNGDYDEYIVKSVSPKNITRILIPNGIVDKVTIAENALSKVVKCGFYAEGFDCKEENYGELSAEQYDIFFDTAKFNATWEYMYFRGVYKNRNVLDVYNVRYVFK